MSVLARAFLDELDEQALDELARLLAPRLERYQPGSHREGAPSPEPGLLSPAEAAARVGLSRRTVYRALEARALQASKAAGRWRIEPEALRAWLQAGGSTGRPLLPGRSSRRPRPGVSRSTGSAVAAIAGRG